MKVKDLKAALSGFDDEDIVVLAKDGEGNSFSPLADVEASLYSPDNSYRGETSARELTAEMVVRGFGEEDILTGATRSVTLWPTN